MAATSKLEQLATGRSDSYVPARTLAHFALYDRARSGPVRAQWHHMLTSTSGHPMTTVAGLEANTLAEGLFHLATWICVAAGSTLLYAAWRDGRLAPPRRAHLGLLLTGWGLFNLIEGLIDHQLLGVHHVRDDVAGPIGWDLAFLALGAAPLLGGWALSRRQCLPST